MAAVSIVLDDDSVLIEQAEALETHASQLRDEATELNRQARELRTQYERHHRAPLEVLHADALKMAPADRKLASSVLRCLESSGPCASSTVAEHVGITGQRAGAILRRMHEAGIVARAGMKRGSRWALAGDELPAVPHDRSDYRHLIRDAARRLGTFTIADIHAELPMLSDPTVRRHVNDLHEAGSLVVERVGKTKLYGWVRATGPTLARPRQATPEAEAVQTARRYAEATSGRRARTGNKRSDELLNAARAQGAEVIGFSGRNHAIVEKDGERTRVSMTPGGAGNANRHRLRKIGVKV